MVQLTEFQIACMKALKNRLAESDFRLRNCIVVEGEGQEDTYVETEVEGTTMKIWIYDDGASIDNRSIDRMFEKEGYDTPKELIEDLVNTILEQIKKST